MGACRQFLHCPGSCVSNISALCCSPKHITAVSDILYHKGTENMYTGILDDFQLCKYHMYAHLDNGYMGQDILFITRPCNMQFAQIYILAEMSYGKTCPDLGTSAQLSSHDARPYALSVYHSGWRWVLRIPIPTECFTGNTLGHSKNLVQSPLQYILIQT